MHGTHKEEDEEVAAAARHALPLSHQWWALGLVHRCVRPSLGCGRGCPPVCDTVA